MRASVPVIGPETTIISRRFRFGRVQFGRLLGFVELVWRVHRERSQLKRFDEHMLKDLGLSQDRVERETERHLFDLPEARKENLWS